MKVPLYELTSADIKSGLYGESEKNIKAVFDQLEKKFKRTGEYSILFVDEANDLFRSANDGIGNAGKSLTNLFLQKTNKRNLAKNAKIVLKNQFGCVILYFVIIRANGQSIIGGINHAIFTRC